VAWRAIFQLDAIFQRHRLGDFAIERLIDGGENACFISLLMISLLLTPSAKESV